MRAPSLRPSAWLLVTTALATGAVAVPAFGADPSGRAATADPAAGRANEPPPGFRVLRVPSESMAPTITVGQNVLVRLYADPSRARPAVGTIVVANPPRSAEDAGDGSDAGACVDVRNLLRGRACTRGRGGRWTDERYLKRIVAGPCDTVAFREGRVIRNGQVVDEPALAATCAGQTEPGSPCTLPKPITLPRNRYFLVGDNRGESNDSRFWGPVPRAWLIGEVTRIGVPSPTLFR